MTDPYRILRYGPEFRDRVLRLQTRLWSSDLSVNDAYLRWKHEQNPYTKEPLIFLAVCGDEVVGMRTFFGTEWQVGSPEERFVALYADDFAIAPEHRNRGLVSKIMRKAFDDLADGPWEWAVNLSAGSVTLLASLSAGWRRIVLMEPLGRRARPAALLGRAHRWLSRRALWKGLPARILADAAGLRSPFARIDRAIERDAGRLAPGITALRSAPSEAMAELVARLPWDGRIRHVRDARYLDWRYRNPQRDYRFLLWRRERVEGYLVLQTRRDGPPESGRVSVVDWEGSDARVRTDLLEAAIGAGDFAELTIWKATVSAEAQGLLRRAGFSPIDPERTARGIPSLIARPIRDARLTEDATVGGRRLLDPGSWDLRMIYSMHG